MEKRHDYMFLEKITMAAVEVWKRITVDVGI